MLKWEKTGRTIKAFGETIIKYEAAGSEYCIESRKREIPHANGRPGGWMFTSYFLINKETGEMIKEYMSLKDAKEAAEERTVET